MFLLHILILITSLARLKKWPNCQEAPGCLQPPVPVCCARSWRSLANASRAGNVWMLNTWNHSQVCNAFAGCEHKNDYCAQRLAFNSQAYETITQPAIAHSLCSFWWGISGEGGRAGSAAGAAPGGGTLFPHRIVHIAPFGWFSPRSAPSVWLGSLASPPLRKISCSSSIFQIFCVHSNGILSMALLHCLESIAPFHHSQHKLAVS